MIVIAVISAMVASVVYLIGYEATRYLVWWRFHDRFAWWQTLREEWHRL